MLSASELLKHFPDFGFDKNRSSAVWRAFVEDGVGPKSGGPNRIEKLGAEDVTHLIFGTVCGATIKKVSLRSGSYYNCRNDAGIRAGDFVAGLIAAVKNDVGAFRKEVSSAHKLPPSLLLNSRLEIDQDFPRITFVTELPNNKTHEWVFSPVKDRESTFVGVRNIAVISGTVLFRLAGCISIVGTRTIHSFQKRMLHENSTRLYARSR